MTASPDELAPIHSALAAAGCRVLSPLLAGHGVDVTTLAGTTRAHWLESASTALDELRASGDPVTVVGGSAGALLAICLAARRPRDVSKVALLATPLSLGAITALQIRLLLSLPLKLRPRPLRVIRKPRGVNVNDRTLAADLRSLPAYPLEALGELLDLMREAAAQISRVTQPVLIAHGALDTTVPVAQANRLAAALVNARSVDTVVLPGSAHLVGIDRDREALAAHLIEFVRTP